MEPVGKSPIDVSADRLVVRLRAYVEGRKPSSGRKERRPSGIAVIFDTETTTDPSQRLRFGAYQVRDHGHLIKRGLFYAEDIPPEDLTVLGAAFAELEPTDDGEGLQLLTRAEFVEQILFGWGLETGGLIVGFNLPFDISRLAIRHTWGKGAFKGGFSCTLAEGRPNVRIKHLSQRASFIEFAGKDGDDKSPDRGFFVDVKTLAAALTSGSHSLQSLTKLLGVTPKSPLDDYSGPLTQEMIAYGLNDVQATWECFAALKAKFDAYGLDGTGVYELYSEASLGKAFLQTMRIEPWLRVQPKFPPELIGQIMSTYYGGRAEVHIRREITPVIHCDFRSMYPTVCTLMGLWRYVIACGVDHREATDEVNRFVETCTIDDLRRPETWRRLTCIVQIEPDDDVLPVRAAYGDGPSATIGLNHLTAREPMWFTLADVLAAKFLGGKPPMIVRAVAFTPQEPQANLAPIMLEGETLRPETDDFYKRLIDQRGRIQALEKHAPAADRPALKAASQSLKILANSTSYGIFVELNVQSLDRPRSVTRHDFRGRPQTMMAAKVEDPGRYFHPLLGTLITGAARLMLALAERSALDQGLDWAFCDTDSLAIANTAGLDLKEFVERVEAVRAWFEPLNPYEKPGSILQLEKVNFPPGHDGDMGRIRPVNCLAISAKRYVLFDRGADGQAVIRKASAHGLGHLVAPYPDPDRGGRIGRIGVELWQEDLWREIIAAFDTGRPDQVDLERLANFDQPAASRYAATNQALLKWFDAYNADAPRELQIWPFNFLLSFQAKSHIEMAATDPDALASPAWRKRTLHPASRYSNDLIKDRPEAFDRETGQPIPWTWLKSYARSLTRHHMHPEMKFLGGDYDQRGRLERRHVHAWAMLPIGKEADNLEEREYLGEGDDDVVEWSISGQDRRTLAECIAEMLKDCAISDRTLLARARVGRGTLAALRRGCWIAPQSLLNLATAIEELRHEAQSRTSELEHWRQVGRRLAAAEGSVSKLAARIGVTRQYLGRVLRGEKPMTDELIVPLKDLADAPRRSLTFATVPQMDGHTGRR